MRRPEISTLILSVAFLWVSGDQRTHSNTTVDNQFIQTDSLVTLSKNGLLQLNHVEDVELKENLVIQSDLIDIAFDDKIIVGISRDIGSVVLYGRDGNQTRMLSSWGMGPFELNQPTLARISDQFIVVWDAGSLKYVVFDRAGAKVDEFTHFTRAVSAFEFDGNRIVAFVGGGHQDDLISSFHIQSGQTMSFGEAGVGHIAMDLLGGGRHYLDLLDGETVVYAFSNSPNIHTYNFATQKTFTVVDNDSDFESNLSEFKDIDDVQEAMSSGNIVSVLYSNSRTLGVYRMQDYIIVATENGAATLNESRTVTDTKNRYLKIKVYDADLKYIDEFVIADALRTQMGFQLKGVSQNKILFLRENYNESAVDLTRSFVLFEINKTE